MKIHWSIMGLILGSVFFLAIWLVKPIGISTQFSVISSIIHNSINPNLITKDENGNISSLNPYLNKDNAKLAKKVKEPFGYDLLFFLGVPLGSLIGFLVFSKNKKILHRIYPKEILVGFFGGFLLLYGARMAGGCTSGHMMSGIMQSSLSGLTFAICVFISGILYTKIRRKI